MKNFTSIVKSEYFITLFQLFATNLYS